jgi:predicted DNA-binding antitoxin AbrB/MazE fold protein
MTRAISAVYEKGVFTPRQSPGLAEYQEVQLIVIHSEPVVSPKRSLFSRRKQALLSKLRDLGVVDLFDLSPLPQQVAQYYLERPVSVDQVRASLADVPGEYLDRQLEAEREED